MSDSELRQISALLGGPSDTDDETPASTTAATVRSSIEPALQAREAEPAANGTLDDEARGDSDRDTSSVQQQRQSSTPGYNYSDVFSVDGDDFQSGDIGNRSYRRAAGDAGWTGTASSGTSSKHAKKSKKSKKTKRSHRESRVQTSPLETDDSPVSRRLLVDNMALEMRGYLSDRLIDAYHPVQTAVPLGIPTSPGPLLPTQPLVFLAEVVPAGLKCPLHGGLFQAPVLAQCGHTFCFSCIWLLTHGSHRAALCPVDGSDLWVAGSNERMPSELRLGDAASPAITSKLRCFPNLVVGESVRSIKVYCPHGVRTATGSDDDLPRLMVDKVITESRTDPRNADSWVRDSTGCQEVITVGELESHAMDCPFTLVPCPNNSSCELIYRKDLEAHVRLCSRKPCFFRSFGCRFEGDTEQVEVHVDGGSDTVRACLVAPVAPFLERSNQSQQMLEERVDFLEKSNQQLTSQLRRQQEDADEQGRRQALRLHELEATVSSLARELRALLTHETPSEPSSTASSRRASNADFYNAPNLERKRSSTPRVSRAAEKNGLRDAAELAPQGSRADLLEGTDRMSSDRKSNIERGESRSAFVRRSERDGVDAAPTFVHAQNAKQAVNKEIRNLSSHAINVIEDVGANVAAAIVNIPAPAGVAPVNMNCIGTYTGHSDVVWALCTEPTRGLLFSASSDRSIKVWDVAHSKCTHTLKGHEDIVHALTIFSADKDDKKYLCSGSSDKTIRVWNIRLRREHPGGEFECLHIIKNHDKTICSLVCLSSAALLFSGSYTEVRIFDLDSEEEFAPPVQTLDGYKHWVRALAVSEPDGWLYSASFNVIQVWDVSKLPAKKKPSLSGEGGSIYSLAVAPEKRKLLAGTYENLINIWHMDSRDLIQQLSGHIGAVYTLCVMPEMNRFYSGSYDSTIKVWNIDHFKQLQTLVRHNSTVTSLATMGGCLFSASADRTVKVWR